MKRIICFFSIILLLAGISIPAFAATTYKPVITVYKYNDTTNKYDISDPATATTGDLLMVRIAVNSAIPSLASLRFKFEYSKDLVTYINGSFTPELVEGNCNAGSPIYSSKDGYFVALFSSSNTSGNVEIAQNVTGISTLIFNCTATSGNIDFKVTLDNVLDKNYKDIPFSDNTASKSIAIPNWVMSERDRAVFEKLNTIVYAPENAETDSKKDIELADKVYNGYQEFNAALGQMVTVYPGLSAAEKLNFKNTYPEMFADYQSAWTRYYDIALNAGEASVNAEVSNFKSENAAALAVLAPENVTIDNYQKILDALTAYKKLSTKAKLRLTTEKNKLDALKSAAEGVEASVDADQFATESFIDAFANTLWCFNESNVNNETYKDFMTLTASAKAAYEGLELTALSDTVKAQTEAFYAQLVSMTSKVTEVATLNGESEEIQKEITEFTSKWYSVMKLNAVTVGVGDETAIEMMLADYNKLSNIAKERLASQKKSAEQLLELIKELGKIQNDTGSSDISVVPQSTVKPTTIEVIKEKEVPVEVVKTVNTVKNNIRNVPKIVYIIVILMGAAILTTFVPIAMYIIYKKKSSVEMEDDKI